VAIRKEDWPSINQAIADAITSLKPRGWRKALFVLREWGVLGTIATLIVALLGIAATAFYQATARMGKEATFETNTERDIRDIKTDIQAIRGDLAKQSLINHAFLPLSDFKTALPDLNSAITTVNQQNVKVPSTVKEGLQQKLKGSTDAPDFWPTAAKFISYRSQIVGDDIQGLTRPDLPNCTDHEPCPMEAIDTSKEKGKEAVVIVSAYYDDCRFTLDSPEEADKVLSFFKQRSFALTFRHCQIVWHGGQIKLLAVTPRPNVLTSKGPHRPQRLVSIDRERLSPSWEWARCECGHPCQSDQLLPSVLGASGFDQTPSPQVPTCENHNQTAWPALRSRAWLACYRHKNVAALLNFALRSTNCRTGIRAV
jgi:hypothetical protein